MSGQWEVVTKKRDKGSKLPVPKVNNPKEIKNNKNILNGVKIEEVLPKAQVQSLYGKSKENKVQDKNKPKESVKKAAVKKDKPVEPPKPKPPKSIESALNSIDVNEFKDIYEKNRNHFPDAPIVWLKELLQYLNQKIPIESHDPVFASKPVNYPLNVVPSDLLSIIEKAVKEAGKNNAQLFFDICLTSMATDMSKGLPSIGYKIFLQYIALQEPRLVTENLQKHVSLRNSYQNRPNIGQSILWGVSHVGYKDFSSGLIVFQDLFLPLIDMKNYSRYILTYLVNLIKNTNEKSLTLEESLSILNIVYSNRKNMPSDLVQEVSNNVARIKPLNSKKGSSNIEIMLKNIVLNNNASYQKCLCDILVEAFHQDPSALAAWSKAYSKNVQSSAVVLEHISNNWSTVSHKINKSALTNLLNNLSTANVELSSKKRKEEGLKSSINSIQKIQEKLAIKKKGGFPYKLLILLTLAVGGAISYDIKQHGSWNDSLTRKTLKEYKVCEYSHLAIDRVKSGLHWTSEKIEEQFPGLQQNVAVFSEPYVELLVNLGKIGRNVAFNVKDVIVEKYPVVVESVEAYLPGLVENSQKAISEVYITSVLYFNRGVDYLKNEVFVGQLSPENMQRVVVEAFNTTQQKAVEYYHWIYKKVQTSIK
ncbi:transmembrane protein 214 [Diabrotica virgifera virgifera]|uniref:Transmembrane protein 214-A n=1 Tax=Diabrotica virgifera virgifera TaxID=50390 RepID=A0ABM5JQF1_DIAVI|nr:transmembrane protein 214 [Diabrotica virgifera virgifera]